MTVGIPGTGVSGLFYLAAAVVLPFRALGRRLQGRPARFRTALQQALMAGAMFAGMWVTGWLVALVLGPELLHRGAMARRVLAAGQNNVLQWAIISFGYLLLGVLLLAVQVARVVVKRRRLARRPSGEHRSPVAAIR